jgi:multidrug efflux pump subunit AcrA (membrane-fusion protein)
MTDTARFGKGRLMLAAGFLAATLAGVGCKPKAEEEPKPVVEVKFGKPVRQDVEVTVSGPATLFPREQASVAARVTAPIREIRVRKGDTVTAGQVMAVLDNRDAVAQKDEAAAAVVEAEENLNKTRNGTQPSDVEKARGQLSAADAAYNQAQKVYDKRKNLFEQGALPQKDLLQSQTDLATTKANYDVAKRSLELLEGQSNKRDLAIAESHLNQAKARLDNQSAMLRYTAIQSPFAGSVTEQFMYPGDMANPAGPMFTVADMSTVTARTQLPESAAAQVREGMTCRFVREAAGSEAIAGKVTVVNRAIDPQRRTVEVWCELSKPPSSLRVSDFGRVMVVVATDKDAWVVPLTAIERKEGTDSGTVTVVDSKNVAHKKDVTTGVVTGDLIEVKQGLSGTERLAVEGNYETPDGATVQEATDKKDDKKDDAGKGAAEK